MKGTKDKKKDDFNDKVIEKGSRIHRSAHRSRVREPFQSFPVAAQVRGAEASMPSASFLSFIPFLLFMFRLLENTPITEP